MAGGRRRVRELVAGDGYLSQSSKTVHFGLGDRPRVDEIVVRWPGGGREEFGPSDADRTLLLVQGAGRLAPSATPRVTLARDRPLPAVERGRGHRILLKTPLALPPTLRALLPEPGEGRATLINLWAHWCEPCVDELTDLARNYGALQAQSIDVVALSLDRPEDAAAARNLFDERIVPAMGDATFSSGVAGAERSDVLQALLAHVLGQDSEIAVPTSLLMDRDGTLQMIYVGPLTAAGLLEDARRYALSRVKGSARSLFDGRWYFRSPRDLAGLARDLRARGRLADAVFYENLSRSEK
ncbi:MAG: redoxin domain-containing protein [bacterium]|nr:redoxin domain-containing protein [bacterium]